MCSLRPAGPGGEAALQVGPRRVRRQVGVDHGVGQQAIGEGPGGGERGGVAGAGVEHDPQGGEDAGPVDADAVHGLHQSGGLGRRLEESGVGPQVAVAVHDEHAVQAPAGEGEGGQAVARGAGHAPVAAACRRVGGADPGGDGARRAAGGRAQRTVSRPPSRAARAAARS